MMENIPETESKMSAEQLLLISSSANLIMTARDIDGPHLRFTKCIEVCGADAVTVGLVVLSLVSLPQGDFDLDVAINSQFWAFEIVEVDRLGGDVFLTIKVMQCLFEWEDSQTTPSTIFVEGTRLLFRCPKIFADSQKREYYV